MAKILPKIPILLPTTRIIRIITTNIFNPSTGPLLIPIPQTITTIIYQYHTDSHIHWYVLLPDYSTLSPSCNLNLHEHYCWFCWPLKLHRPSSLSFPRLATCCWIIQISPYGRNTWRSIWLKGWAALWIFSVRMWGCFGRRCCLRTYRCNFIGWLLRWRPGNPIRTW